MTYATELAGGQGVLSHVWDLPTQRTRFVERWHEGLSLQVLTEANLLANGSFETRTGDDFGTWSEVLSAGNTITADTSIFFAGAVSAKLTRVEQSAYLGVEQTFSGLVPGRRYALVFRHRASSIMSAAVRAHIRNETRNLDCWPDGITWTAPTVNLMERAPLAANTWISYAIPFTPRGDFALGDSYKIRLAPYFFLGNSVWYDDVSIRPAWTVFEGAMALRDEGAKIDVRTGRLTVGGAGFQIPDVGEGVTSWLKVNDGTLYRARVSRKIGFEGLSESEFQETRWLLQDLGTTGRGGGYDFELANVLADTSRDLYSDIDGEAYRLDPTAHASGLAAAATTITLEKSPKGRWREPGKAFLWDPKTKKAELVSYATIGGTGNKDLQTVSRRLYGVGDAAFVYPKDDTSVWQVWAERGNPIDLALRWLTTTSAGGNGAYDAGDGDGLGLDSWFLDLAQIEDVRDELWPQPTFTGDALTAGTAVLFVEKGPIPDLKRWIEDHCLRPFGLFPAVGADERLQVETYYRFPITPTTIGDDWDKAAFRPSSWRRGWPTRINTVRCLTDWNLAEGAHELAQLVEQASSISKYGASKGEALECRGGRSGLFGFPDYGSDDNVRAGASKLLLEAANPFTDLEVVVFYRFKDLGLTNAVALNVPAVPNLRTGSRGMTTDDLFLVTRRQVEVDPEKRIARVRLGLRLRRPASRPAFVAPNTVASSYTSASAADRAFCYLAPGTTFANSDDAYTVIP